MPELQRPKPIQRVSHKGGGVQVVLEENGGWADNNNNVPSDGEMPSKPEKGMLGFLKSKKGRDRSPKPKDPAVLGKIGARQIIN